MRRVILESPFAASTPEGVARHVHYGRLCMRDCLLNHGESPIASHLLLTQKGVLDDSDTVERALGIEAGLAWGAEADATVVYEDLGRSSGMTKGIERATHEGRPVEFRKLPELAMEVFHSKWIYIESAAYCISSATGRHCVLHGLPLYPSGLCLEGSTQKRELSGVQL